jgi:hypothetical protein
MPNTSHRLLIVALLGACTTNMTTGKGELPPPPNGSDSGHSDTSTLTGVVEIDNAIQNATVYLDENDNNLLDGGEPSTTTDATGHYTFSWPSAEGQLAHAVGAIVNADSIRAGTSAAVGFAVHLRAPLIVTHDVFNGNAVISPLTTLVASEMDWDRMLGESDAQTALVASLKASTVPFSSQPLDLMSDYAASYTTSSDAAQLRFVASAVAATVADAVKAGNAVQSHFDCNNTLIFTPAIAAMDDQLTALASAIDKFQHLTAAQQADIQQNAGDYHNYFINTSDLATTLEAELVANAEDLAAELFAAIQAEFVKQLEEDIVRIVAGELIAELLG